MTKAWNQYQTAIFDAVAQSQDHLVVVARAGTGKTTTILEALNHVPPSKKVLLCAFNKRIQTELEQRAPRHVAVKTLHSLGFAALRRHLKPRVDGNKARHIAKELLVDNDGRVPWQVLGPVLRLVGLAKNTLKETVEDLMDLAYQYNLVDDEVQSVEELAKRSARVLDACRADVNTIDFDDMIWMPHELDCRPTKYDLVFVDEAQDLNAAQRWLVLNALRRRGRLVAVGDDRQAIYGFRGAGRDVLNQIRKQFDAQALPLSITYRCPQSVVKVAKTLVPDYQAHETNPEGRVLEHDKEQLLARAHQGDFVLSRTNAPLARVCLRLLRQGTPAVIAGRDIGQSLIKLIEKSEAATTSELDEYLERYLKREADRLLPDYEQQFELLCDRVECLRALCEGWQMCVDVKAHIERLFRDDSPTSTVVCSTVHKAKGLERPRVWLLSDTFRVGANREEDNIYYVAVTRAQRELIFVEG